MLNVVMLSERNLESIAIGSIIKGCGHRLTSFKPDPDGLTADLIESADVVLLDADCNQCDAATLTGQVVDINKAAPVAWLSSNVEDARLNYHAMVSGASGCISKRDIADFVDSLERVASGEFLYPKLLLVTFLRQIAPMVPVVLPPFRGRKQAILELLQHGCTNQEIAGELHLSVETVKHHVGDIKNAFNLRHRRQFAVGLHTFEELSCSHDGRPETTDDGRSQSCC